MTYTQAGPVAQPVTFLAIWVLKAVPIYNGSATQVTLHNGHTVMLDVPFAQFNADLDFRLGRPS